MKREELKALGLTDDKIIDAVLDAHHKELDPVQKKLDTAEADLKTANEKLADHQATIDGLNKSLEKFKDVDVSDLQNQIATLNQTIKNKDDEHSKAIADRDFQDILKESIAAAGGKNAKAITALLDLETLKASKNQKVDIDNAIKQLAEAEDSSFMFGNTDPEELGEGNPIGAVHGSKDSGSFDAMRAAMGLPPEKK